jgi:hypothetical protein
MVKHLTLLAYIRLGLKGFPEANTLAYLSATAMTNKESFIIMKPGPNDIKLFRTVIYECS